MRGVLTSFRIRTTPGLIIIKDWLSVASSRYLVGAALFAKRRGTLPCVVLWKGRPLTDKFLPCSRMTTGFSLMSCSCRSSEFRLKSAILVHTRRKWVRRRNAANISVAVLHSGQLSLHFFTSRDYFSLPLFFTEGSAAHFVAMHFGQLSASAIRFFMKAFVLHGFDQPANVQL